MYEIWKYNEDNYKFYTEDKALLEKLFESTGITHASGTYLQKGVEIGWDVTIPADNIKAVKRLAKQYETKRIKD